ncbi:hypothetical protein LCGC14_1934940 [marine sediment metagenome]|uniref:Capsule biosynthesis phosphatase n=1 Tax=marine sediment metagenome TaxID=412755 RepID=A0A0F9FM01_9ZZZZ
MKKRIILDFDGTICGFDFPQCGPPEPGVRKALLELSEMGFEIIIHSCRTGTYWKGKLDLSNSIKHHLAIMNYMTEHRLFYDTVIIDTNMNKPIADFYIDDRGINYRGNWPDVVNEIRKRKDD